MATKRGNELRVLIQDRSRLFRECCKLALETSSGFCVLGGFPDGESLVLAAENIRVDAVLFELGAVPWNLTELVSQLGLILGRPILVGITGSDHGSDLMKGITCINRTAPVSEIAAVLAGGKAENPGREVVNLRPGGQSSFSITEREFEVLLLIAKGFTTAEIGKRLRLSPKTIESRRQTLFSKLGVQNQSHAVAVAARAGLLGDASMPVNLP